MEFIIIWSLLIPKLLNLLWFPLRWTKNAPKKFFTVSRLLDIRENTGVFHEVKLNEVMGRVFTLSLFGG
jgi:hypothetical protein